MAGEERELREELLGRDRPAPSPIAAGMAGGEVFRLADSLPSQGRAPQSGHRWQNGSRP